MVSCVCVLQSFLPMQAFGLYISLVSNLWRPTFLTDIPVIPDLEDTVGEQEADEQIAMAPR